MNLYIALAPMSLFTLGAFYLANKRNSILRFFFGLALAGYIGWLGILLGEIFAPVLAAAACLVLVYGANATSRLISQGDRARLGLLVHLPGRVFRRYLSIIAGALWSAGILMIFAVGLRIIPGGESWLIAPPMRLGSAQVDWLWRVKLFNALLGIGLIILFYKPKSISISAVLTLLAVSVIVIVIALAVGTWQNTWRWDPKLHSLWPWFCILMCSFTVIPEEAVFRYCIQARLRIFLGAASVFIAALLFGLVHLGGGLVYAAIATLAGLGYAYVWHRYNDILLCSACHWLVNVLHFSLLTYPY